MKVSIACLIFKSVEYLDFVYKNLMKYTPMIKEGSAEFYFVTNNAIPKVLKHLEKHNISHYKFTTPYKQQPYPRNLSDIYRAWNYAIEKARGEIVVLINSDMGFSKNWLENLVKHLTDRRVITSRLVESGKLRSTFPHTLVKDFGRTPEAFQDRLFQKYVKKKKRPIIQRYGTFMPVAFYKEIMLSIGGYPLGNVRGLGGDQYLFFYVLEPKGIYHYTSFDSLVYHIQEGEVDAEV